MIDTFQHYIARTLQQISELDAELILLAILATVIYVVLEKIHGSVVRSRSEAGISEKLREVYVDGSRSLPVKSYYSERLGLAGKPDALIVEDGFIIPVERKPLAKKIRDRYVAQLLVYMRLVEDIEGIRPPYGYLVLGPNCRRVKIENTPERQAWLQGLIDDMRSIHAGAEARPDPHPKKCSQCSVRERCEARVDRQASADVITIGRQGAQRAIGSAS